MKVSFELSARDIRYFRDRLKRVKRGAGLLGEDRIVSGAAKLVGQAMKAEPPEFVIERLRKLELLIGMLRDRDWQLEGPDRKRILDAIAYFVDPEDLIPDGLPGIGYLDDAIMVELVVQELQHELEAYDDFCRFRESNPSGDADSRLKGRRQQLHTRMRRRRRREREQTRAKPGGAPRSLRLW